MNRRDMAKGAAAVFATGAVRPLAAAPTAFRVPAEDHRHEATLMMWPASPRVYGDTRFLRLTQNTIIRIANTIAAFEDVILLAEQGIHARLRSRLSERVTLWDIPTEDLWARDAGPLIATDGTRRAVVQIAFNGWGNRQVHRRDSQVASRVGERLGFERLATGLTGEPGGVEHDGAGLLLAHESSWVNKNRNPGLTRDQVGARLLQAYGADRIIWSRGVYDMDITDYHIDSLARFTRPGRVLINQPRNPDMADPFHRAAADTEAACRRAGLTVDVIHEPDRLRVLSDDFVASYMNYYVCNRAVIAASFGDGASDKEAADALSRHYPGRQVVTLNVDALGMLGGGIHCATQQVPLV